MVSAHLIAHRGPWNRALDLVVYHRAMSGEIRVAQPLALESMKVCPESCAPPVTCSMAPEAAQDLMDQLWACGFRPTAASETSGAIGATVAHLNDMRAMVAKVTGTPLPGIAPAVKAAGHGN